MGILTTSTQDVSFSFEILCGFPIREFPVLAPPEDPTDNPITVYFPMKNVMEEYTLDQYRVTGGNCLIYRYILDNDNDRNTPFQSMPGIQDDMKSDALPCNVNTSPDDVACRTVRFNTNFQGLYVFWIHIQGESPPTPTGINYYTSP